MVDDRMEDEHACDDDAAAWMAELASVKPLEQSERVAVPKKSAVTVADYEARRTAAQTETQAPSPLTLGWVAPRTPHEVMGFRREGVQEGVFKKLRLGGYACQGLLDLHRKTLAQAADSVYTFVQSHYEAGHRSVRIIHGRGIRSQPEPALLKRYCAHWLTEIPSVLAYHSAQPKDGGAGALYILLRKNPDQKANNRHRHQHREG
jgi:DNA-nicking Smr family endonuclease